MLDGKGWIVPCLLSEEECEQLITLGEEFGIGEEDFKASHLLSTIYNYCFDALTATIMQNINLCR